MYQRVRRVGPSIAVSILLSVAVPADGQFVPKPADAPVKGPDAPPQKRTPAAEPAPAGIAAILAELERRRSVGLPDTPVHRQATREQYPAIQSAADAGDADAKFLLSVCYAMGLGVKRDPAMALKLLEESAADGSGEAMADLARIVRSSTGDEALERKWLERARDTGNRRAAFDLNFLKTMEFLAAGDADGAELALRAMANGKDPNGKYWLADFLSRTADTPQRAQEAREWLARAAEAGHFRATGELGWMYCCGGAVAADPVRGMSLLRKAADAGEPGAMLKLAQQHWRSGEAKSKAEVRKWVDAAIDTGHLPSITTAAEWLAMGKLIDLDAKRAWELSNLAVESGYARAYIIQSYMHREGVGVAKNVSDGFRAARKAALAGVPAGMNELACYYRFGWSVPHDEKEAIKWFEKGARLGDPTCLNSIGGRLQAGRGMKADPKSAFAYYYRAATLGGAGGAHNVGWCYQYGVGVERNIPLAIEWFTFALRDGMQDSATALAVIYLYENEKYRNVAEAKRLLNAAVAEKSPVAMRYLADLYDQGIYETRDFPRAYQLYFKAAEMEESTAMLAVARALQNGRGVEKQPEKAISWLKRAAMAGHGTAYAELGSAYLFAIGVERDPQEAMRNLKKAVELGDSRGRTILGMMYRDGNGVEVDRAQAIRLLTEAHETATDGVPSFELARLYVRAIGGEKPDNENAIRWLKISAERGNANACTELGDAYLGGRFMTPDPPQAIALFKRAADMRYAPAENRLGLMYRAGRVVEKDITKAAEWFERAADDEPRALENHADMLVEEEAAFSPKAVALYERAIAAGRTSANVKLARYYLSSATPRDPAKALDLAKSAAAADDPSGMAFYGMLLSETDPAAAVPWLTKAAEKGSADAMFALGTMYERGTHFAQNDQSAADWFRQASEKGHVAAMYSFGVYNALGRGVPKNQPLGVDWLKKAARGGHAEAQKTLKSNGITWDG